jgi:hypothetical protein
MEALSEKMGLASIFGLWKPTLKAFFRKI